MNLIEIRKLSFNYPDKEDTLKNINLKIKQGEFVCIVGENGSGKSTLIKCIVGLNNTYKGDISIKEKVRIFATENRNTKQFSCFNRGSSFKWYDF